MDDIIKIVESLENSGLLIDGASETAKHEIKKQGDRFFPPMMALMTASLIAYLASELIQHVASSLTKVKTWKGVIRASLALALPLGLSLPLMMKVLGKGFT